MTPRKDISIPRMELLAATLGARLMNNVSKSIMTKQADIFFWSDSSTVLSWLRSNGQWATFVWNRVKEIRQLTNISAWYHVPGSLNPADLPFRGCGAFQLMQSRWWEGADWLRNPREEWPNKKYVTDENLINAELKRSAPILDPEDMVDSLRTLSDNLPIMSYINVNVDKIGLPWYLTEYRVIKSL